MKIFHNLAFGLVTALILSGGDWIYSLIDGRYSPEFNTKSFLVFWFLHFVISCFPGRLFMRCFYLFVLVLGFVQMVHMGFFGTLFFPIEVLLAFTQGQEILFSIQEFVEIIQIAGGIFLAGLILIFLNIRFLLRKKISTPWIIPVFIFLVIFSPLRSVITEHDFGKSPDPKASTFYNAYGSISWFAAKILPQKFIIRKQPVVPTPDLLRSGIEGNIILVMGESINPGHLGLYGYHRDTTPNIDSLSKNPSVVYGKSIACGVSTDVSLPLFFNKTCSPESTSQIKSTNTCLFRMAKESGYQTTFLSAQSGEFLKGIYASLCPEYIDEYKDGSRTGDKEGLKLAVLDHQILKNLDNLDLTKKNLIVLHNRAPHSPYNLTYPPSFDIFPVKGVTTQEKMINSYDNGILYIDSFLGKVVSHFKKNSSIPFYVIFTADHGESLGEGGRFGHLQLFPEQYTVPLWIYSSINEDPLIEELQKESRYFTHLETNNILTYLMGYGETLLLPQEETMVIGADIDGLAGYLKIKLEGENFRIAKLH